MSYGIYDWDEDHDPIDSSHDSRGDFLSDDDLESLIDVLLDTDDSLEIGVSQIGYDPEGVHGIRKLLGKAGVRQCVDCGLWFRRRNHKSCCE